MALITKDELIVYLDLPALIQPNDRAQLVCTLVIEAVNRVAGSTLSEPFAQGLKGIAIVAAARLYQNPLGLWSETVGGTASVFPGSRAGTAPPILTEGERADIIAALAIGGPVYSFPEPDWHWTVTATALQD